MFLFSLKNKIDEENQFGKVVSRKRRSQFALRGRRQPLSSNI